ncbi:hypothetical protein D3C75_1250510 [compost metagenome]
MYSGFPLASGTITSEPESVLRVPSELMKLDFRIVKLVKSVYGSVSAAVDSL